VDGPSSVTGQALATGDIDLTYYPLADEIRVLGLLDYAYKLVTQNAAVPGVAPHDLQIGGADASQGYLYSCLAWQRMGEDIVSGQPYRFLAFLLAGESKSFHQMLPSAAVAKHRRPVLFEQNLFQT
jgi:hypothetical protein